MNRLRLGIERKKTPRAKQAGGKLCREGSWPRGKCPPRPASLGSLRSRPFPSPSVFLFALSGYGSLFTGYFNLKCNAMQCNTMQCNVMQCNATQYNRIQYNTIQYNAMQYMFVLRYTIKGIGKVSLSKQFGDERHGNFG